ncbi:MAG: hypothetical protein KJO31_08215 [Gammaproteobacteria bacterium]|nr:hypothetical protein [Gammaproteobacteria bacterium]
MISDEKLVLYFYKDGLTPDELKEVEAALRSDPAAAERYTAICSELQGLALPEDHRAPDQAVQRWHDSVDRAAKLETSRVPEPRGSFDLLSFAWGGALAAAIALVIGLYLFDRPDGDEFGNNPVAHVDAANAAATPVAFTRGLTVHLRDSETELSRLPPESVADRMMLMLQIVEQNRVFERAADANNAPDVARLLRAFEPILLRLATDEIAPEDVQALRAQLAFELKVMLTKLERQPSEEDRII